MMVKNDGFLSGGGTTIGINSKELIIFLTSGRYCVKTSVKACVKCVFALG